MIGAGSPSKLASNPACVCIIDEADKTTDFASQGEAPALELAEDRTISFPNDRKFIVLSTPTVKKSSVVESQYLLGSQSKYFVACPHCHREQVLEFKRIKWPSDCKDANGERDLDRVSVKPTTNVLTRLQSTPNRARIIVTMVRAGCCGVTRTLNRSPQEIRSSPIFQHSTALI